MKRWTALMPMKQGLQAKSRLAAVLDGPERAALAEAMAAHVVCCLRAVREIGEVRLLAPEPAAALDATWLADAGRGLNAELASACANLSDGPVLVIHADLPKLAPDDVEALLSAADKAGAAIAPDRHEKGTNALALARNARCDFAFGSDSLARHRRLFPGAAIVRRPGLAFDLDTPDDLAEAREAGLLRLDE